jgi:hypothetical protein
MGWKKIWHDYFSLVSSPAEKETFARLLLKKSNILTWRVLSMSVPVRCQFFDDEGIPSTIASGAKNLVNYQVYSCTSTLFSYYIQYRVEKIRVSLYNFHWL